MLKLSNVNVHFGKQHVLKNLSCHANKGDFIVLVGTNGSGKSTFFDTIAGKAPLTSGTIELNGQDITGYTELQRSCMATRIFQNTTLNSVGSMTVEQNLAIAMYSRRRARLVNGMRSMPTTQAEKLIADIGMEKTILKKTMRDLSGGQRQLIAFVMATQLIPRILLLDEPTAALDPQAATRLLDYATHFIKKHAITTILITHDPYIAIHVGNKIWVLQQGTIVKQFGLDDKKKIHPDALIGHIDYARLAHY